MSIESLIDTPFLELAQWTDSTTVPQKRRDSLKPPTPMLLVTAKSHQLVKSAQYHLARPPH